MTKYIITCNYCGNISKFSGYYKPKDDRCFKCNDKNLTVKEVKKINVFGYSEDDLNSFDKDEDDMFDLFNGAD